MENESQEFWLLEVFHPSTLVAKALGEVEIPAHWSIVGLFRTPNGAKKAFAKLMDAGRVSRDEFGNSWKLQRMEVRD